MRRLRDFSGDDALKVVAALVDPLADLAKVVPVDAGNIAGMYDALLRRGLPQLQRVFHILRDESEQDESAGQIVQDIKDFLSDADLMALFTMQGQIAALSGSASEISTAGAVA